MAFMVLQRPCARSLPAAPSPRPEPGGSPAPPGSPARPWPRAQRLAHASVVPLARGPAPLLRRPSRPVTPRLRAPGTRSVFARA
jgi:hypothetical protein